MKLAFIFTSVQILKLNYLLSTCQGKYCKNSSEVINTKQGENVQKGKVTRSD